MESMRQDEPTTLAQVVEEALNAVDIPGGRWAVKGAGLGVGETRLYWAILHAFPILGGPPDPAWLAATAATLGVDAAAALAEFARRDLILRDPVSGRITSAYPFSGTPTPHQVTVADGRPVYAMCAVDALGIPFMLGRDATIRSADPMTGAPVRVEVRAGEARWDPADAVVFIGTAGGDGPAAQTRCPVINFFASAATAAAYQRAHPDVTGQILTPAEAVAAGRRVFGAAGADRGDAMCCQG